MYIFRSAQIQVTWKPEHHSVIFLRGLGVCAGTAARTVVNQMYVCTEEDLDRARIVTALLFNCDPIAKCLIRTVTTPAALQNVIF